MYLRHRIHSSETSRRERFNSLFSPLYTCSPLSQKLMIVLHSALLPNPLEDADDEIRRKREMECRMDLGAFGEDLAKIVTVRSLTVA